MKQKILPVIGDYKTFDTFLKSEMEWCVLMDFHMNFMEDLLQQLHKHQKKGIVHMDLVKGLQNDAYGTQYMCQKLHADGIISTKAKSIESAKTNHVLSILRVFMIDSRSLVRSAQLANTLQPDFIEILPAVIPRAVAMMRTYCDIALIGGGLIQTKEDITYCLAHGMSAITTSSLELCKWEDHI